uniref:DUF7869 domain-containing protein n=1 Tax=Cacopsylla melanoneura TaxID=428564 RepID=A0A8D8ZBU7_9HEMI
MSETNIKMLQIFFFEKMKTFKKMSSVTNDEFNENNTLAICFDYQKNLPLPVTNIQDEYYKRQLWLHNFGIHDLKKNQATMYLYPEHYAQKGPDEVISCLSDYIEVHKTSLQTNLIIFCDNCFSQNKNKFLFAYLDTLTSQEIFSHIEVIYPVPGHSMMPIDSDFGAIEKKRIKEEKVYSPDSYVTLIKNCKKKNPFEIVFVEHSLDSASSSTEENIRVIHVQNYKETMNAKLKSSNPGISKARRLVFQTRSKPMLYLENGKGSAMNLYNVGISKTNFAQQLVYNNKYESLIPVKIAKKKDIEFLIEFIPPEYRDFYRRIPPTEPNAEYLDLDDSDIDFE